MMAGDPALGARPSQSLRERVVNALVFQAGWLGCVLGAARGMPTAGTVAAMAVVLVHLLLSSRPLRAALVVAVAAAIGMAFENALAATGWVSYDIAAPAVGLAPIWMVSLWAAFATTLSVSMAWLQGRPLAALAFGAIGGPLSYGAGARLGALRLEDPLAALTAIAFGWAVATPLLMMLARRVEGGTA
jgi:hypothetical protein